MNEDGSCSPKSGKVATRLLSPVRKIHIVGRDSRHRFFGLGLFSSKCVVTEVRLRYPNGAQDVRDLTLQASPEIWSKVRSSIQNPSWGCLIGHIGKPVCLAKAGDPWRALCV
jgi:hypothetical protein